MRLKPPAKVIAGEADIPLRPVSRVDLGMYDVRLGQQDGEEVVYVCRKAAEARLVAHEAVDVDHQQSSPLLLLVRLRWHEGLRG